LNLEIIIIFMLVEEKIISSLEEVLLENNFDYNKTINDFVNVLNKFIVNEPSLWHINNKNKLKINRIIIVNH